jgi:UDP-N-acetylmuramoylalanine--D-glutamate ligase
LVDHRHSRIGNIRINQITLKKNLIILGAGESGTGAAILGVTQGWNVFVSDKGPIGEKYKEELNQYQIEWEERSHSIDRIMNADLVIKSPGIPDKIALIQDLKGKNIQIVSEIEFAGWYTNATMIGISGTNGKTTTTLLTYQILKDAGLNVGLAGNIGHSLARQVATESFDIYVLELSSFQLDGNEKFKLHIACLTNITPDHLDRYDYKIENYINSKMRLAINQTDADYFIYCADDALSIEGLKNTKIKAKLVPFSLNHTENFGAYADQNLITINLKNNQTLNMQDFNLRGRHNTYNTMAAAIISNLLDVRKENIRESLSNFQNVEHRLETVIKTNGIEYINDSKATNVNSTWYALESMDRPVIWIAGGVDKGNDYTDLKPLVKDKVKIIICMGIDNLKIHQAFQSDVDMIINTLSPKEAVHVASRMAANGDVVLLSPACASFDLFENYEDRGRQFKAAVRNL